MQPDLQHIANRFAVAGPVVAAEPYGSGHINDSYRLTCRLDDGERRYLLQRINTDVFPNPALLMENIENITAHIARRLKAEDVADVERRVLTLVPTREDAPFWRDPAGAYWRLYRYIESTQVYETPESAALAEQAGRAIGAFQRLLADYAGPPLHETIPDFHNTLRRYEALEEAIGADVRRRAGVAREEIEYAREHGGLASALLDLHRSGLVPQRIVHNDPKVNNVLYDRATGEAVCVIDLDTVMPGLALYDFGDMVRSMTCTAAEDETDLGKVDVQMPLFEALARGYVATAGEFLTAAERDHLVFAGILITLEQGVRFLTDFLLGDVYYKTARAMHNIDRCRTQFKLVDAMLRQQTRMTDFVTAL